jgi:hypothetical protein
VNKDLRTTCWKNKQLFGQINYLESSSPWLNSKRCNRTTNYRFEAIANYRLIHLTQQLCNIIQVGSKTTKEFSIVSIFEIWSDRNRRATFGRKVDWKLIATSSRTSVMISRFTFLGFCFSTVLSREREF